MGKGSRREREFVELCHDARMGTYRPATVRFGENDVMGLFDVLAFSPRHRHVYAVQVKSNGARGIQAWADHTTLFRRLGFRTFYAVPEDNRGWRLIECRENFEGETLSVVEVDERDGNCPMGQWVVDWLTIEGNTQP